MLDFDYVCRREKPSVACIVNPTREGMHKCFWGTNEIMLPMYRTLKEATTKHKDADVMVNFASFRSAYETTKEALETKAIRTVAVIAEGVPEKRARELAILAKSKNKWIIGPATVGGLAAVIGLVFGLLEIFVVPAPSNRTSAEVTGILISMSRSHPDYGDIGIVLDNGQRYYINRADEVAYLNWERMLAEVKPGDEVKLTVVTPLFFANARRRHQIEYASCGSAQSRHNLYGS